MNESTLDDAMLDDSTVGTSAVGDAVEGTAWLSAIPFLLVHLVPFLAFFVTVTWQDWVLCAALYVGRMFLITAGYHRYFAHRSYKMGRVPQFLTALGATTAAQKGPLWWAGHHRIHHRFTDTDGDVHSPRDGFWWSHVGWILSRRYKDTDVDAIRDFAAYPELRLLDKFHWVGPWVLGVVCLIVGGWGGLIIGFFLSTVLLWHGTFIVNSLAHVFGRRRFATPDTSRNSLFVALVTGGEGWHNNHHYLPASARQGLMRWEIDTTWYVLRGLAALHIVRDVKRPPARLLDQSRLAMAPSTSACSAPTGSEPPGWPGRPPTASAPAGLPRRSSPRVLVLTGSARTAPPLHRRTRPWTPRWQRDPDRPFPG